MQLKAINNLSGRSFPKPTGFTLSFFPAPAGRCCVAYKRRQVGRGWFLPSVCAPVTHHHRTTLQARSSGRVRIVRHQAARDKGWGLCPKRPASAEGPGWPWLPAAGEKFLIRTVVVWRKRTEVLENLCAKPMIPVPLRWRRDAVCAPTVSGKPGDGTARVWPEDLVGCPGDPVQFVLL